MFSWGSNPRPLKQESSTLTTRPRRQLVVKVWKAHYKPLNTRVLEKNITFKFVRFTFVAYVSLPENVLVTDIFPNITSQEHLTFT